MIKRISAFLMLTCFSLILLQACTPTPRRTLTSEEKKADMLWLYSQFGENYAPMQYKETRYNFKFEKLKQDYLVKAENAKTNEEFYQTMYAFVAEFKDAHTSAALYTSSLPGRTQVAYLGFHAKRKGDNVIVTKLIPSMSIDSSGFPIKTDDVIVRVNGLSIRDAVASSIMKLRNLGNEESNTTALCDKLFNRNSVNDVLPFEDSVTLTLERILDDGSLKYEDVTLPWIKKDLLDFTAEQKQATETLNKGNDEEAHAALSANDPYMLGFMALSNSQFFEPNAMPSIFKQIDRKTSGFDFLNTFLFVKDSNLFTTGEIATELKQAFLALKGKVTIPGMDAQFAESSEPIKDFKANRLIPDNAIFLDAINYPTYINFEDVKNAAGELTGKKKPVAYMFLNTFNYSGPEKDDVLDEVRKTISQLQAAGVQDLIIDMLNNGGGSLELGVNLAQTLSSSKVQMPLLQLKLSDTWIDQFQSDSLSAANDYLKELNRRNYVKLIAEKNAGLTLSQPYSVVEVTGPSTPNATVVKPFKIALMVNEMCASMCDIFAAILQDNKMATVVGSRTMGAGGNVVNHQDAPNSHIQVRQTESLILRQDGSYIENNGVTPDVALNSTAMTSDLYEDVHAAALTVLTKE